jgi:hypothetical protein
MKYLTLDPYLPMSLWITLASAGVVLLAWYGVSCRSRLPARRWTGVIGLMAAAVVLPLLILLNPTWVERIPPPAGKPLLTILVDASASMATPDGENRKRRYELACGIAGEMSRRLESRYEIRFRRFAGDSAPASEAELIAHAPQESSTDLAAVIGEALGEDRPQGRAILLLSDGIHNAAGGAARVRESVAKARAISAPVLVKTLGGQASVADLEVELNLPEELAFVGQRIPVVVNLRQRGSAARRTGLSLQRDGQPVERRDVRLLPDGSTEEVFYVSQRKSGLYRYEIKADPLPAEVTSVNNTATLLLRVVDEPIRVLLLEGKPYWDTKFLIRTLTTDRLIELVSVVQLAEGRLLQRKVSLQQQPESPQQKAQSESPGQKARPRSPGEGAQQDEQDVARSDEWTILKGPGEILGDAQSLDSYQVVVLGRQSEVFLADQALARLEKWLHEGQGSLVCYRGSPSSQISQRLGALMPVRWTPARESRFRMHWTDEGRALRWLPGSAEEEGLLASLPSLATAARPERPRPLAVVLATTAAAEGGGEDPALVYQRVGSGRVVVVEGAGMWRWAFLPTQYQDREEVYGLLWRSLVRWLVANIGLLPSQRLALRTDKVTFTTAESITAELLVRKEDYQKPVPAVELTSQALDRPRQVTPQPAGDSPGQYRVPFGRLPEGRYTARVVDASKEEVSATTAFDVRENLKERLDVQARPDLMAMIARESGGTVLGDARPQDLAEQFERHLSQSHPERLARTMAWDRWWVLAAALGVWVIGWGLRRRSGLV